MAQGSANKVWVVPSDFSAALQGFTRLLGTPGDDGVFRFEPSPVDDAPKHATDDDAEVADWFSTETDPAIAQAVAKAEAIARQPVDGPGAPPELTR
jgi:hypothetical protein